MASHSRVLYTGVTNDLDRRVWEHRNGLDPALFTTRYRETYEWSPGFSRGNHRPKPVLHWYRRSKKIALIEKLNPE